MLITLFINAFLNLILFSLTQTNINNIVSAFYKTFCHRHVDTGIANLGRIAIFRPSSTQIFNIELLAMDYT